MHQVSAHICSYRRVSGRLGIHTTGQVSHSLRPSRMSARPSVRLLLGGSGAGPPPRSPSRPRRRAARFDSSAGRTLRIDRRPACGVCAVVGSCRHKGQPSHRERYAAGPLLPRRTNACTRPDATAPLPEPPSLRRGIAVSTRLRPRVRVFRHGPNEQRSRPLRRRARPGRRRPTRPVSRSCRGAAPALGYTWRCPSRRSHGPIGRASMAVDVRRDAVGRFPRFCYISVTACPLARSAGLKCSTACVAGRMRQHGNPSEARSCVTPAGRYAAAISAEPRVLAADGADPLVRWPSAPPGPAALSGVAWGRSLSPVRGRPSLPSRAGRLALDNHRWHCALRAHPAIENRFTHVARDQAEEVHRAGLCRLPTIPADVGDQ